MEQYTETQPTPTFVDLVRGFQKDRLSADIFWLPTLPEANTPKEAIEKIRENAKEIPDDCDTRRSGWIGIISEKLQNAKGEPLAFAISMKEIYMSFIKHGAPGYENETGFIIMGGRSRSSFRALISGMYPIIEVTRRFARITFSKRNSVLFLSPQ